MHIDKHVGDVVIIHYDNPKAAPEPAQRVAVIKEVRGRGWLRQDCKFVLTCQSGEYKPSERKYWERILPNDRLTLAIPPNCPGCSMVMMKRRENLWGGHFWGCTKFPHCHGTRNLWEVENLHEKLPLEDRQERPPHVTGTNYAVRDSLNPEVSKTKGIDMADSSRLIPDQYYILRKPAQKEVSLPSGIKIVWDPSLEAWDGQVLQCKKLGPNGQWAYFEGHRDDLEGSAPPEGPGSVLHYIAILPAWVEGPMAESEVFRRRRARRRRLAKIRSTQSHTPKVDVEKDTTSDSDVESFKKIKELEGKIEFLETELLEQKLKKKNNSKLDLKFNPLEEDDECCFFFPSSKDKFDVKINKIFTDYHDRNQRREEIKSRLEKELNSKSKTKDRRLYKTAAVVGSISAFIWSGWTLWPYLVLLL